MMGPNEKYIDRENALRYMGCKGDVPESFIRTVDECERELCRIMTPRYVFSVKHIGELGTLLSGNDIASHLDGCDSVVLFGATLGGAVDETIRKYQSLDVTKALVIDAEASASAEAFCDDAEREIAEKLCGKYLTWRFSPGYGDFPMEAQKELLCLLDAERRIGLVAGESFMLTPIKSVTAVLGVTENKPEKVKSSCVYCSMRDRCGFRKDGTHCGF